MVGTWKPRVALLTLGSALALATAVGGSGCSNVEKPKNDAGVIASLKPEANPAHKDAHAKWKTKPNRLRLAIAPVRTDELRPTKSDKDDEKKAAAAAGGAPAAGAADGAGAKAAPAGAGSGAGSEPPKEATPPPADKQGSYAPRRPGSVRPGTTAAWRYRRASTGEWVALCYRRPLYRELLFSPRDGEAPAAPADAQGGPAAAPAPQPGDVIEYLCPRCQRTVAENDGNCADCGLAFLPESEPVIAKPPVPPPPGPVPPVPPPPGPGPGPVPPPAPIVVAEAFICFQCGSKVTKDQGRCEVCEMDYADGKATGPGESQEKALSGLAEGTIEKTADGYATYVPDKSKLQADIVRSIQSYGVFADVVGMQNAPEDLRRLLEVAGKGDKDGGYDYLIVPSVKRWEITYAGLNGFSSAGGFALWLTIGEPINLIGFPTAWVATERYRADIVIDMTLYNVRQEAEVGEPWRVRHAGFQEFECDWWDRGYYPWSIAAIPFSSGGWITTNNYRELHNILSPCAMNNVMKSVLESSVFETFVAFEPKPTPSKRSQTVALVVGTDTVGDREVPALRCTIQDVKLMQDTFASLGLADGSTQASGSRYITFEGKRATREGVLGWLKKELPRLAKNDVFLLYFTGYGASTYDKETGTVEKYLCLADTDPRRLAETAISTREIGNLCRDDSVTVQRILFLLDTSFAAPTPPNAPGDGRTVPGLKLFPELSAEQQRTKLKDRLGSFNLTGSLVLDLSRFGGGRHARVLAASEQDQAAMEYTDLAGDTGHGLFTFTLAEAFRGAEGAADINNNSLIDTNEIAAHVTAQVRQRSNVDYVTPQYVVADGDAQAMIDFDPNAAEKERARLEKEKAGGAAPAPAPAPK